MEIHPLRKRIFVFAAMAALFLSSHDMSAGFRRRHPIDALRPLPGGLGVLPKLPENPENPITPAKFELGRQLFEDARLSGDESLSCASCHPREMAYDAYVRALTTPNSPFDRYAAGDTFALTDAQKRGLALFVGKAECAMCHRGPNFAHDQFHALGIGGDDAGRFKITGVEADRNAFKTPTLRNVALTAPYMHDGSLATLRQVIDFYNAGGGNNQPKSMLLRKLNLTEMEKSDLLAFLESLSGTVEKMEMRTAAK